MSGTKYLLDTNIVIGILKNHDPTLAVARNINTQECGYSAITRMELLGFPGISEVDKTAINKFWAQLAYFPITTEIEDTTIALRQQWRIKLPDAIITATAQVSGLELLTLGEELKQITLA